MIMHWTNCMGLSLIAVVVFIVASIVGSQTRANSVSIWTKDCTIYKEEIYARFSCGRIPEVLYTEKLAVDNRILNQLQPISLTCSAYPTNGFKYDVMCEE